MSERSLVSLGALLMASVAAPALAQDANLTASAAELDEVVVVGVLTDVALQREEIERTQANDLADLFRATPSVAVGGSLGIAQKIYVRGLEVKGSQVRILSLRPFFP